MQRGGAWCRSVLMGIFLLLVTSGASTAIAAKDVAVINIGWHTGIALKVDDIDSARIPESEAFARFAWIEFGWGDRDFYQTPDPDISVYLSAAFVKTPTVMHLVGIPNNPKEYFRTSEVMAFSVTDAEHERLQEYLARSFKRSGAERTPAIAHGLYPASLFYDATGFFSLAYTCNSWVAVGLAEAGLLDRDNTFVTAGFVMKALRSGQESRRFVTER